MSSTVVVVIGGVFVTAVFCCLFNAVVIVEVFVKFGVLSVA